MRQTGSDSSYFCSYREDDISYYECLIIKNYDIISICEEQSSPLENTAEDDADKGDAEHDDDAEVETEKVLDPLTVVQLLLRDADAGPVPECDESLIHVV